MVFLKEYIFFSVLLDSAIRGKDYIEKLKEKLLKTPSSIGDSRRIKILFLKLSPIRKISKDLENFVQKGSCTFLSIIPKVSEIYYGKIEKFYRYFLQINFQYFKGFAKYFDLTNQKFQLNIGEQNITIENKIAFQVGTILKCRLIALNYFEERLYFTTKQKELGVVSL